MKKIIVLFVVCAMFLAIVPISAKAETIYEPPHIDVYFSSTTGVSSRTVGASCLVILSTSTEAVAISGKVDKTGTDCIADAVAPVATTKLSASQQTMVASAVKNVQLNLIKKGYSQVKADGIFGKTTANGLDLENIINPAPNPATSKVVPIPTDKGQIIFYHTDGTCRVWFWDSAGNFWFQNGTTVSGMWNQNNQQSCAVPAPVWQNS